MLTKLNVVNPATEETITTLTCDTADSIRGKFEQAQKAQLAWAARSLTDRVAILAKFSQLLETRRDRLAKTLTSEVGKPLKQSINEVNGAKVRMSFAIEHGPKYLATETMTEAPGRVERIVYEPLGVIGNISAWNYPWLVGVTGIVPSLIAGNAVLYKPSEFSPLTGMHMAELLWEAGVPRDIFVPVLGDGGQGAAMTELPLNAMFFTGSVSTGKRIHQALAGKLIPTGFELGGKDPIYVCEDADLAKVVPGIADGVFYNNGQSCCSVERIYVPASIYDRFVEAFVAEVKTYKLGDPLDTATYLGPLTRNAQRAVLVSQTEDAVKKGAKLLTGGKNVDRKGYYFEPTVLANVNHTMTVMKDESFGPIIGIQRVADDGEAIKMMNDTVYGLTAGVYTPDQARAEKILAKVDAGSAYWNCCDRVSPALPWSGRRDSGLGSSLSHYGMRAVVKPKAYHLISG